MLLKGNKVLVTGATGFIGSHLVQRLVKEGASVRALSHYRGDPRLHNLEFLTPEEMSKVEIVRGNVEDSHQMLRCVEGCDTVFHLAALIAIPYSYVAPSSYVSTNVQGTLNVLEACRMMKTPRLIHTSTSECYGSARFTPMDESHPLQGQSPYSASKIAADKLVESYYCSFQTPAVTIRPFNTFGPRQSARAVISTIISQLLTKPKVLKLGSTSPIRDFTFVTDTVNGFICAALASDNVHGETINLGVGRQGVVSIGEVASKIMKLAGIEIPVKIEETRVRPEKSEVVELVSNNDKAQRMLNWKPKITLDEGLEQTIQFIKENPHLFKANEYGV